MGKKQPDIKDDDMGEEAHVREPSPSIKWWESVRKLKPKQTSPTVYRTIDETHNQETQ